ncbi:type II toxin-antitoxin system RelE/ParE family toxin [Gemmatimonadota bacterium]
MVFVESISFTQRREHYLSDDDFASIQAELVIRPRCGAVIKGTGGLRKLRVRLQSYSRGKRGGARIIYLHLPDRARIHLLLIYGKEQSDDLTPEQKKTLRQLADSIKQSERST